MHFIKTYGVLIEQHLGCSNQACTQKIGMGGSNSVNSRSQMLGAQPPAAVAYLTKDNPENPLLTHTAKKYNLLCNSSIFL